MYDSPAITLFVCGWLFYLAVRVTLFGMDFVSMVSDSQARVSPDVYRVSAWAAQLLLIGTSMIAIQGLLRIMDFQWLRALISAGGAGFSGGRAFAGVSLTFILITNIVFVYWVVVLISNLPRIPLLYRWKAFWWGHGLLLVSGPVFIFVPESLVTLGLFPLVLPGAILWLVALRDKNCWAEAEGRMADAMNS
jgi:hypothetical protein